MMQNLIFKSMPSKMARAYQSGKGDFFNNPPELQISDGSGVPCRHCQRDVEPGKPYLVLAYQPFNTSQPYAEVGPIFLCADACERYEDGSSLPEMYFDHGPYLLKAYLDNDRIYYGMGRVVVADKLVSAAHDMLADPKTHYVHVRSALNNCFWIRIERDK